MVGNDPHNVLASCKCRYLVASGEQGRRIIYIDAEQGPQETHVDGMRARCGSKSAYQDSGSDWVGTGTLDLAVPGDMRVPVP